VLTTIPENLGNLDPVSKFLQVRKAPAAIALQVFGVGNIIGCVHVIPEIATSRWTKRVVLATDPGTRPAVRIWTRKMVRFGSRPVQIPDWELLGGANPYPYPSTSRFYQIWLDPSVVVSGSPFRVFLFMVTVIYVTVYVQNINFGTSLSLLVSLAGFILKTRRDMLPATS